MVRDIKIHNNLTRKKEFFSPIEAGKVKFYSCGPTTYDFLHVGNARALVVGDLFHRIFEFLGYHVTFVRNFTDVDDKIIERANSLNRNALEHAALFVKECEQDMKSLGLASADFTPKVSDCMPEIIKMIEEIIKNGSGYVVKGEVLYDVASFKEYGKLSKKDLESLQYGIRVEVESHKKNPSDFVLWKPAKPGEPSWDSPWGKGRPGWHIECSAMAKKFLGNTLDLHHGGVDLMFPHHENEIAQSEAANQCTFCNYWAHNEFLNFSGEKMSKSLGNFVTIRSFIEKYSGQVLRQILMSVHYRARLEWADEVIERAISDVQRLHTFYLETLSIKSSSVATNTEHLKEINNFLENFTEELSNDFNTAGALGQLFTFIRFVRRDLLTAQNSTEVLENLKNILKKVNLALGCFNEDPQKTLDFLQSLKKSSQVSGLAEKEIEELILERKEAKQEKNWKRADEIRRIFDSHKIQIQDHPDGSSTWKYN